jgi:nucleoid DNA-binding protein
MLRYVEIVDGGDTDLLEGQTVERFDLDEANSALAEGQEVRIAGFGVFSVKKQKPRQGRNPKTGASVAIPAKNVVLFRPSSLVKSRVQK